MKNEIVLILPFFGRLPWYFNYFLKSLADKRLDVLFVSDLTPEMYPDNFKILHMTLPELVRLLNRKLGTNIALNNAYKLCDFKPMYGKIFEDYVGEYAYWAFGDCDMIFGTQFNDTLKSVLGEAEVSSFQRDWIAGPFTILKNCPKVNDLYLRATNLDDVYRSETCLCFDELCGQWFDELKVGRMTMAECERQSDSFSAVVWRSPDISFSHENVICEDAIRKQGVQMRDDGRLYFGSTEIPLFHFINAKHRGYFDGVSRPYSEITAYHLDYTGSYHTSVLWALRHFVRPYRKIDAHRRWYTEQIRNYGIVAFLRYIVDRLMGRGR